ncbi:MAG: ABC transporter permease [Blastocatellia bacterium]
MSQSTLHQEKQTVGPLPEEPIVRIRPVERWDWLDLRSVWLHRELLYFLTMRDIRLRYKQTVIGLLWVILQPTLTMVVFSLFFGKLAGIPSDGIPYPIFAYAGLLPWMFFSLAVTTSSNSLVGNASLITKVYFPRMIIPGAAVLAALVDLMVASLVLAGLMVIYQIPLRPSLIWLPFLVLLMAGLAFGAGLGLSALNLRYRDVRLMLPFLLQLLMFSTPIIYPVSLVPGPWRSIVQLNPLAGLIGSFRAAIFGQPINGGALIWAVVSTALLLIGTAIYFRGTEQRFADHV